MPKVGISLGSNLGDSLSLLREAVRRLEPARSSAHLLLSPVYETAPVDCPPGSPPFLNAAVEIETDWSPRRLLALTQGIESELGRPERRERNAPRPIDLDLLYYGDLALDEEDLRLPHPRMRDRAFVLVPLRAIRPDLVADAECAGEGGISLLEGGSLLAEPPRST
jgi:2-amino-4-hydroxy-6-hydroxymethyldihydropteridine diphosphokinase